MTSLLSIYLKYCQRKHRYIVETCLALLAQASIHLQFWDEAFLSACYLINRLLSRVFDNNTPLGRLLNTQPDYTLLRTFGCICWPNLRPYATRKLEFRSQLCVFLRYSSFHKGFKCLDKKIGRIYISSDVIFYDNVFPFFVDSAPATITHSIFVENQILFLLLHCSLVLLNKT
jgi:hypothetical protein